MPLRSPWSRVRPDIVVVLGIAALLRVALFVAAVGSPRRFWSQDDREYIGIANHLHASYVADAGHWFEVGLRRPPVYPLVLRAVFDVFGFHYAAVIALHVVIGVATVGLTFWLARMILPRRFAVLAAFLVAIDPASIVFGNLMLTETLFAFLLTLAIGLVIVGRRDDNPWLLLAAGLVLGVATLTRPISQYLPVLLVAVLVLAATTRRGRSVVLSAALVVGFVLPVGAWIVRNAAQTGVPIVSTIDGHNMLDYRAVGALVQSGERPAAARAEVARRLAARVRPGQNPAEVSREQLSLGLSILADHPVGAVKSWAKGEAMLLGGPAKAETATLLTGRESISGAGLRALILVDQLITLLIVGAALVGVVGLAIRRIRIPELWLLAVTVAYLVVISGGPEAYSRFRVPVTPLLAVLGAAAAAWLDGLRLRRSGRAAAPTAP